MELQNWVQDRFSPVVMISSTPEAEALCQEKNGLSVADLLRPHGYFHHLSGECKCLDSFCRSAKDGARSTYTVFFLQSLFEVLRATIPTE